MGSIPIARSIQLLAGRSTMQIQVNGAPHEVPEHATLSSLLEALRLSGRRLAVELNGEIVPRSTYGERRLQDRDVLEIVHAIGGG